MAATADPQVGDPFELDDRTLARSLWLGAAVGVPLVFLAVALMTVLAGEGLGTALAVAAWPSVVVGPYAGGLTVLIRTAVAEHGAVEVRAVRPAPARPLLHRPRAA